MRNIFLLRNFFKQLFNRLNNKKIFIFSILLLLLIKLSPTFAADTTSCYVLIEGKTGCSGLTSVSDITHTGQLKCFTIDKTAKDCGVFVNVLPFDTDQGLNTGLEAIDCTGANKSSEECAEYCFNNPSASTSECVDCNSLTESEKADYPYCQDEENAKYCEAKSDDGNGSSWPETLAGVVNIAGTCLDGYTGSPTRNCSSEGIWEDINNPCTTSQCENSSLNSGNEVPNAVFTNTTGTTLVGETQVSTSCETGYDMTGIVIATCENTGTWSYANSLSSTVPNVEDSCKIKTCNVSDISSNSATLLNSEYTDSIIQCTSSACSSTTGEAISLSESYHVEYGQYFKVYSCLTGYGLADGTTDRILKCDAGVSGGDDWILTSSSSSSKYCHIQCTSSSPVISANNITLFNQAGYMPNHCVTFSPSTCGIFQGYTQPTGLSFNVTSMTYYDYSVNYGSSIGIGISGNYSYMTCKKDTNDSMYFEYNQACCLRSNLIASAGSATVYGWTLGSENNANQNALCSNHYYFKGTCSNSGSGGTIAAKCGSDGNWIYVGNVCKTQCDNSGVSSIATNVNFPGFSSTGTTNFGTILTGTCNTGYELTGADAGITSIEVTCNSDTTWTSNLSGTGCTGVQCQNDDVESIYATLFGLTPGGTTSYPTSYTQYQCPNGYEFVSGGWEITLQCQADGTWAFGGNECVESVVCQNNELTGFVSQDIDINGTTLHDTCVDGYAPDQITPKTATCGSDGNWTYIENATCSSLLTCNNSDLNSYNILDEGFSYSETTGNEVCVTAFEEEASSGYASFIAFTCSEESWNGDYNIKCPEFEPDYSGSDCQNSILVETSYWSENVLPSGFNSSGTTSSGTCIDTTYSGTPEAATCYNGSWASGYGHTCSEL